MGGKNRGRNVTVIHLHLIALTRLRFHRALIPEARLPGKSTAIIRTITGYPRIAMAQVRQSIVEELSERRNSGERDWSAIEKRDKKLLQIAALSRMCVCVYIHITLHDIFKMRYASSCEIIRPFSNKMDPFFFA